MLQDEASDNSGCMRLGKTVAAIVPILFVVMGISQSWGQGPTPPAEVVTATVPSSTVASEVGTNSTTVAMDLFEDSADKSAKLKFADMHPRNLWVPYPDRRELTTEIKSVVDHLSHQRRELASIALDRIVSIRTKLGIRNLPLLSTALARESRISRSKGDIEYATALLNTAAQVSPELFQVHLARLQLSVTSRPTSLGDHAGIITDYLKSRVVSYRNQRGFVFQTFLLVMMSLALAIIVFTVVQVLKYTRYIVYTFARLLPSVFSQVHVAMLGVLVLCTPLAFGIGWMLSLGLLIVTLWSFQKDSERYVGFFSWLVLLLVPVFLIVTSTFISNQKSIDSDILSVLNDLDSEHAYEKVLNYSKTSAGSKNIHAQMAVAFSAWVERDYNRATMTYSAALNQDPNSSMLLNNKGKLLYFTGEKEKAKEHFQLAMKNGDFAEPLLNYASLILDEGKFEAAQAALARARRINPRMTQSYGDISAGTATAEKLLFIKPSEMFAWRNVTSNSFTQAWETSTSLFRQSGNPLNPILVSSLLFIVGIVGMILVRNKKSLGMYIPCTKCARPTRWVSRTNHCDQCQSVFLRSESIDPAKRQRKKIRVENYQSRITLFEKVMSPLPGLSDVATDRAVTGFVRLLLFSFLFVGVLIFSKIRISAFGLGTHAFYFMEAGFGTLMVLMILLSVRRAYRA